MSVTLGFFEIAGAGCEQPAVSKRNSHIDPADNAFSNASGAATAVLTADERRPGDAVADPLLARFLVAWDRLSDAERLVIVTDAEGRAYGLVAPDATVG